jgi:hypothetical protein
MCPVWYIKCYIHTNKIHPHAGAELLPRHGGSGDRPRDAEEAVHTPAAHGDG